MELVVWKHKIALLGMIFFIFLEAVCTIIFTILIFTANFTCAATIIWFIFLIITTIIVIFDKKHLSKLIFSEHGIRWIKFNKEIMYMQWEDITDIKQTPAGLATFYLTFVSNDKQINMDIFSKKMYKEILNICPNENIKLRIKNLDFLRNYNKN